MRTGPASGFPYFISTTGKAQTLQVNVFHCFSVRAFLHGRNGSKRIASMSPRFRIFYKIVETRWLRFSPMRERRNFRIVFWQRCSLGLVATIPSLIQSVPDYTYWIFFSWTAVAILDPALSNPWIDAGTRWQTKALRFPYSCVFLLCLLCLFWFLRGNFTPG